MARKTKVDTAKKAIDEVHADTSVELLQTYEDLVDLRDHVQMLIEAVGEDMERMEREKE